MLKLEKKPFFEKQNLKELGQAVFFVQSPTLVSSVQLVKWFIVAIVHR
jgi:hypothetical protein